MPAESSATGNQTMDTVARFHKFLGFINDVLLIPMFTLLFLEISSSLVSKQATFFGVTNLVFCASFGLEWVLAACVVFGGSVLG